MPLDEHPLQLFRFCGADLWVAVQDPLRGWHATIFENRTGCAAGAAWREAVEAARPMATVRDLNRPSQGASKCKTEGHYWDKSFNHH